MKLDDIFVGHIRGENPFLERLFTWLVHAITRGNVCSVLLEEAFYTRYERVDFEDVVNRAESEALVFFVTQ